MVKNSDRITLFSAAREAVLATLVIILFVLVSGMILAGLWKLAFFGYHILSWVGLVLYLFVLLTLGRYCFDR